MRKKKVIVFTAFVLGINCVASGMTALAEQNKEGSYPNVEATEMESLRMPQRLEVVIDPWEMDGRSQIYSDQYTIRNTGETTGVLTLSQLTCKPQEKSSVVVRSDKNGLHDNEEKSVYMEMLFGNGDSVVLTEEETEYKAELKPSEEISLCFAGEVNEYAADGWQNGDITVEVVYSWDEEAIAGGMSKATVNQESDKDEDLVNPVPDKDEDLINEEDTCNENPTISEIVDNEEELPRIDEFVSGQKNEENEKKIVKVIDLQTIQKSKMIIDLWEMEDNSQENKFISEEYVLRNTGEITGVLLLDNLRCKAKELSEITIQTDKDELYKSKDKAICIEMVLGNEERMILSQESFEYWVEVKPGEEVSIRFEGEMNGNMSEEWGEEVIEVEAECSWST